MHTITPLLKNQLSRYPGMEPEDAIKLLYQSEMGCEHLVQDMQGFEENLQREMQCADLAAAPFLQPEPIGNGLCRVHLSGLGESLSVPTFAKLCMRFAQKHIGSKKNLLEKLAALKEMAARGELPWAAEQVMQVVDAYIAGGCQPVHHSARFTALYKPHYRVIDEGSAFWLPVFNAIDNALGSKTHVLVGIDGMSGAGKSSLAALLAGIYECGVVHTDDFFLQPHQRTEVRLAEAGGNIDYERLATVAQKAGDDRAFTYTAYNCQTQQMEAVQSIPAGRLTVIEGAYSFHPKVGANFDVRVFLSVNAWEQRRRIEARNGEQLARRFFEEWVPMENFYFSTFDVRQGCDVLLDTSPLGHANY